MVKQVQNKHLTSWSSGFQPQKLSFSQEKSEKVNKLQSKFLPRLFQSIYFSQVCWLHTCNLSTWEVWADES
jgi:hypothetical protein